MMTTPTIRAHCVALTTMLLLGSAAAAAEPPAHDRAALQASLDVAASSSRDQAAIVGRELASRALAQLAAGPCRAPVTDVRLAAAGRNGAERT